MRRYGENMMRIACDRIGRTFPATLAMILLAACTASPEAPEQAEGDNIDQSVNRIETAAGELTNDAMASLDGMFPRPDNAADAMPRPVNAAMVVE